MTWIPNWYALVLLSLASWRTFQLLAWDDIADASSQTSYTSR